MTIILYNSTAEIDVLNKSSHLTQVATLNGTLRQESDVVNPDILMEFDNLPTFNYVYIQDFNRYYFVKNIRSFRNKLWVVSLHVDVLMSYRTDILNITCEVDRNEYDYDLLLEDNERVMENLYDLDIIQTDLADLYFNLPKTENEMLQGNRFTFSVIRQSRV